MSATRSPLTRRQFLALGALGGAGALVGCSADDRADRPPSTSRRAGGDSASAATPAKPRHLTPAGGYFASPWPGEDGGPDRKMRPRLPLDFDLGGGKTLGAAARGFGISNLVILRRPGEVYLQGSTGVGPNASGYLQRVHPESLELVRRSPDLDAGGQFWAGGVIAHANESLYVVHGRGLHKLDPDCALQATTQLPDAAPYNGVLALSDGTLVAKSVGIAGKKSTLALIEPEGLGLLATYKVPEVAFGRISIGDDAAGEHVYVVGDQSIIRYIYRDHRLVRDREWSANYRRFPDGQQGFGWAACVSGGYAWFLDNGNTRLGASPRAGSSGPLHLIRVSTSDATDIDLFAPFDLPNGGIVSPPLYDEQRSLALAYDSVNRKLAAFDFHTDRPYARRWQHDFGTSAHSVLFDNGVLAVNDFREGHDDVVVLDIETGQERGRVSTTSTNPSGLWLSAGWSNDVYYTSGSVVARVFAE